MIKINSTGKKNKAFIVKSLALLLVILFLYIQAPTLAHGETVTSDGSNNIELNDASLQNILNDLKLSPEQFQSEDTTPTPDNYNVFPKLRDNINQYTQVWNPWLTRAGVHVAEVSDDGEFLVVGGGYLLDNEIHIYRWNLDEKQYKKVWDAGSGIIHGDVYDVAFGDSDNNGLLEIAAGSADGRVYLFEQAHPFDPVTNLENKFDLVWKSDKLFQVAAVEFSDTDLDGIDDLVVGSWDKKVHIFEYTKHSGYPFAVDHWIELTEKWVSPNLQSQIQSLGIGDINYNGLPDIVVGTHAGSVFIYENDGVSLETSNAPIPIPNDNNYVQLWNASDDLRPIWNKIGNIEIGELDSDDGTEAVIVAWGQGTWVLSYGNGEFFFEQLIKPFENWQTQGIYPLDNFADWMLDGTTNETQAINVFSDKQRRADGAWTTCKGATTLNEPLEPNECYNTQNSGASDAPDAHYSYFKANATVGAQAAWDFGVGEEIATNGNDQADLFVILPRTSAYSPLIQNAIPSDWNISVSNDLNTWHYVHPKDVTAIDTGTKRNLGINLDPIFALKKLTKVQYFKLELLAGKPERFVDAIVAPYVARPLTLAVSVTIDKLYFDYTDQQANVDINNMLVFGGTDGRIFTFEHKSISTISSRNQAKPAEFLTTDGNVYKFNVPQYTEIWDSFVDDFYNLGTTIWSIKRTSKMTFIPSFRYDPSLSAEFTPLTYSSGTYQASSLDYSVDNTVLVSQRDDTHIREYNQNGGINWQYMYNLPGTTWASVPSGKYWYINGCPGYPGYGIEPVTYCENTVWSPYLQNGDKTLTSISGNFIATSPQQWWMGNSEAITFAWYNDPKTDSRFDNINRPFDAELRPQIWYHHSYYGSYIHSGKYLDDIESKLYDFLKLSTTTPSAEFADLDHDGDQDIIISNGKLAVLWNLNSVSNPTKIDLWDGKDKINNYRLDVDYFAELNDKAPKQPISSPQPWDYDLDGDLDMVFSYGLNQQKFRYGMDFFENVGDSLAPRWERKSELLKNPSTEGSLRFNNFTAGVVIPASSTQQSQKIISANGMYVYSNVTNKVRYLGAEVDTQNSFIVGTNPELMRIDINKAQEAFKPNMGYSTLKSWTNVHEFDEWTLTLDTGILDNDTNNEIIVSDFDNNVYVFEHLTNNTYKRAFQSQDLNHTIDEDFSPYRFQDFEGIDGDFRRTLFDHGNLLATGLDYNNNGKKEFIVVAALSVYIFEATGFNDEYKLVFERDLGNLIDINQDRYHEAFTTDQFSSIAITPDFDGRGAMIALAGENKLFILRYDPAVGWLESFQTVEGVVRYSNLPGIAADVPNIEIKLLKFADINQDGSTELWIGGRNFTDVNSIDQGFLIAMQSEYGNIDQVFVFPQQLTNNNVLNTLEINDLDYDGRLEMIIGHTFGIDIWEVKQGSIFNISRVETISSDPTYSIDQLDKTFGTHEADVDLAARKHDIYQMSNGKYVVIYGNYSYASDPKIPGQEGQFAGETKGVLKYAIVDNPTDIGSTTSNLRLSTVPFSPTGSGDLISDWKLIWESQPSITEACVTCVGIYQDTIHVAWLDYYQGFNANNGEFAWRFMIRSFRSDGVPLGNSQEIYSFLDTDSYDFFSSPSLTFNQQSMNANDLIMGFAWGDKTGYPSPHVITFNIANDGSRGPRTVINSQLDIANYKIGSLELVNHQQPTQNGINTLGVIISGYEEKSIFKRDQLFYISINSSNQQEGIFRMTTEDEIARSPSAVILNNDNSKIAVMYERTRNGFTDLAVIYSSDYGRTWSESFTVETTDPALTQRNGIFYAEGDYAAIARRVFRPQIANDGDGGLIYNFVSHFYADNDTIYDQPIDDYETNGTGFDLATNLFVGHIDDTKFFDLDDVLNVRDIAIGDSDNDLRKELFISHENKVTLLEIAEEHNGNTTHVQKWQMNFDESETGSVAIFDANGNGWAELIFTVKGGDVYSFELSDTTQPKNSEIYLTEETGVLQPLGGTQPLKIHDMLVKNIDRSIDNSLELVVASSISGRGIYIWDLAENLIDHFTMAGETEKLYFVETPAFDVLIAISDQEILLLRSNDPTPDRISINSPSGIINHLITDVNGDGIEDIVYATTTNVVAINTIGVGIWSVTPETDGTSAGYFDLVQSEINGETVIGVSSGSPSWRNFYLLDTSGATISSHEDLKATSDYNTSSILSDYNSDGDLELYIKILDSNRVSILGYNLETTGLFFNKTYFDQGGSEIHNLPFFIEDVNGDDEKDIIFGISRSLTTEFGNGLVAMDIAKSTILWTRTFNTEILNVAKDDINQQYKIFVKEQGVFTIDNLGADVFWLEGGIEPMSSTEYISIDQKLITTSLNGTSYVSDVLGKMEGSTPQITIQDNVVSSKTLPFYKLSASSDSITSFGQILDIANNGIETYFVAMSNGTLTLRDFKLGEYYRISTAPFNEITVNTAEYNENQYAVVYSTDNGYLVFLDRFTGRVVLNVSSNILTNGIVSDIVPYQLNGYDLLLVQSIEGSNSRVSIFDPVLGVYTWNSTIGTPYSKLEIGNLDPAAPATPTHIMALDLAGTASLIELPNSPITGGDFPHAQNGNIVDMYTYTLTGILGGVYLLSSTGVLINYIWQSNGAQVISEISTSLATSLNIDVSIGSSNNNILITTSSEGIFVIDDDRAGTLTQVGSISYNRVGSFENNRLSNIDGSGDVEVVVAIGNMVVITSITGEVEEIHSFSSEINSLSFWHPDLSQFPAIVSVLHSRDIEISDPQGREFSTRTVNPNQISDSNLALDLPFIDIGSKPEATWPEYIPLQEVTQNIEEMNPLFLFRISIFAVLTSVGRKLKRKEN